MQIRFVIKVHYVQNKVANDDDCIVKKKFEAKQDHLRKKDASQPHKQLANPMRKVDGLFAFVVVNTCFQKLASFTKHIIV